MIEEALTYRKYGYCGFQFVYDPHVKVVMVCDKCERIFDATLGTRSGLCKQCLKESDKRRSGMEGKQHTEESRRTMSATRQGIPIEEWKGFVKETPYCEKFNESCRERNRKKYGRICFICGKNETDNGKRLSVHHVDMSKSQGCNGEGWKLVPLCHTCHSRAHNPLWQARIEYLLVHRVYMKVG